MSPLPGILRWRPVRFLVSGGTAAAVNLALLFVLVHFFSVWYLAAAVVAYAAGIGVSFLLHKFFTFDNYAREVIGRQMAFFLHVQLMNLGLNTLCMYVGVDMLHVPYLLSQVLISGTLAVSNFLIYKYLVFRPTDA